MAQRDGKSQIQVVRMGELTASGTTTVESDWVDTRGFDSAAIIGMTGTVTDAGTADGITAILEHSDTTADADAETVPADEIVGDLADLSVLLDTEDDAAQGMVSYVGNKRYVRVAYTGTTGSAASLIPNAILGYPAQGKVADVGTAEAAT